MSALDLYCPKCNGKIYGLLLPGEKICSEAAKDFKERAEYRGLSYTECGEVNGDHNPE